MIHLTNARISEPMEQCIERCTDCHDICLELIDHCLREGGRYADPAVIKLLEDCVEMCQTAANFMVRESGRHELTCAISAVICEESARVCASFPDDEIMQRCVEVCRDCAVSCRSMAWKPVK